MKDHKGLFMTCGRLLIFVGVVAVSMPSQASCQEHRMNVLTSNQTILIDPGSKVTMDCRFQADHHDLFEFPILWRKRQIPDEGDGRMDGRMDGRVDGRMDGRVDGRMDGGMGGRFGSSEEQELEINVMSSINEPFLTSNKYHVGFTSHPPIHNLQLTITNASVEDSGNFTCEFRGPQSNVLHTIKHVLFVRAPISTLLVSEARSTLSQGDLAKEAQSSRRNQHLSNNEHRQSIENKVIHLEENRFAHIRCDSLGGYPPPSLHLFIGRRNVTQQFNYKATLAKVFGRSGFKRLIFAVERTLHNFLPSGSDDQMTLSCVAIVQGLKPVVDSVRLDIDYAPRIHCTAWNNNIGAYFYQSSYEVSIIQCQIRAKPQLTTAFWVLDRNGTTLREGEMHPDYWTVRTEQSSTIWRMELFARQVKSSMFGTYALVAENKVAIERAEVRVSEATTTTSRSPHRPIMSGNRELQRDLGRRRYVHLRSSGISSSNCPSSSLANWLRILCGAVLFPPTSIIIIVSPALVLLVALSSLRSVTT